MADTQATPAPGFKQDLTGRRFGMLVVQAFAGPGPQRRSLWECRCDCGGTVKATATSLNTGHRESCGCLKKVRLANRNRQFAASNDARSPAGDHIEQVRALVGAGCQIRQCPLAPGYLVAETGRVFSLRLTGGQKPTELQARPGSGGYLRVAIRVKGHTRSAPLHRILALTFIGPAPFADAHVRHLDGDPLNNSLNNLAWGSAADNMQDMIRHGRTLRGRLNHNAKLTAEQANEIASQKGRVSTAVLAKRFGVSRRLIRLVQSGQVWSHATGLPPLPTRTTGAA